MTTETWSTRFRSDSDPTFREWGSEMDAKLAAVGMVQTADTGQVNWTSVGRTINTYTGYSMWRFDDSLQGAAPIFLRMDYGCGASTSNPRFAVTVGTGSNGSGTITGTALTTQRQACNSGGSTATTDTPYTSYMCGTEGFLGWNWKTGVNLRGFFFIARTVDTVGAYTPTGAIVYVGQAAGSIATQALRFASPAAAYTAQTAASNAMLGFFPQAPASTLVGADNQAAIAWTITPAVQPLIGVCGVLPTEVTLGTTFNATLVGTTSHLYCAMEDGMVFGPASPTTGIPKCAILWE